MTKHMLRVVPSPWNSIPEHMIFQCSFCHRYITIYRENVFEMLTQKSDFMIQEQKSARPLSYEEWVMCWAGLEKEVTNGEAHA